MLIPQFSLRWLLAFTAVCAVVFSIAGLAIRGHGWAIGVSVAVGALAVTMLVHAAVFGLVWLFSLISTGRSRGSSPFLPQGASPFRPIEEPAAPILLE
jgi:hypothetical protein